MPLPSLLLSLLLLSLLLLPLPLPLPPPRLGHMRKTPPWLHGAILWRVSWPLVLLVCYICF